MDHGVPTATDAASPSPASPAPSLPPPPPLVASPPVSASVFPPVGADTEQWVRPPKRVGQLSPIWRLIFGFGWAAIIACNAAIWETSRVIGLSTWWLGADAQPRLILFQLLPFYGPLVVMIAVISNWRFSPYLGIAAAIGGTAIGAADLGRVRWIAVVELVLGGAALCISAASLAGMYRPARPAESPG